MFLLGLALPLVYIPAVTGFMILSGWVLLSLVLPWMLLRRIEMGWAHWLGLAFLAYASISLLWTPVLVQGVWKLWLLWILAFSFCVSAAGYRLDRLLLGVAMGLGVNLAVALAQAFGWHFLPQTSGAPSGLFVNANPFGEVAALTSIGLLTTRQFWPLTLTLPCIWLSDSRTALLALGVAGGVWLWDKLRWRGLVLALALALPLGAIGWWHKPSTSSLLEREAIWLDTVDGLSPFGRGAGSFLILYPHFATRTDTMATRPESAHNDFLELIFEFGIGAIPLFGLVAIALFTRGPWRYLWWAFCAVALVAFPTAIPVEGFLGMVALGALCRGWRVAWIERARLRPAIWPWAGGRSSPAIPLEPLHPHSAELLRDPSWRAS